MKKVLVLLAVTSAVVVPVAASASTHSSTAPKPHIIGTWPDDVSSSVDSGYIVWSNGEIQALGNAPSYGSLNLKHPVNNIVGFEADPASGGYWLIAADGTVYGLGSTCQDGKLVRPSSPPKSGVIGAINLANQVEGFGMVTASGHAYSFICQSRTTVPIGTQLTELEGSDTRANDQFGSSVAISGTSAVVGAPESASQAGRAYVFTKTASGWVQAAELTGSDTAEGDEFGSSVAISGNTLVVGAPNHASYAGEVYVFTKTANGWTQATELTGADSVAGDNFGRSVAISGTTIVVGAPNHASYTGRAYVFTNTANGWRQATELRGADSVAGDNFGWSVAISGKSVVVGAVSHASYAGEAYVFNDTASGWTQATELLGADTEPGDGFGDSVTISGTVAVVGARGADGTAGRAYVFTNSASAWKQAAEFQESDKVAGDSFGTAVNITGSTVVVGGVSGASVFTKTGSTWNEVADLKGSDTAANDAFGSSVAVSGAFAVVGAPEHASQAGRVYVFDA